MKNTFNTIVNNTRKYSEEMSKLISVAITASTLSNMKVTNDIESLFSLRKKYIDMEKTYENLTKEDLLEFFNEVEDDKLDDSRNTLKEFFEIIENVDKLYHEVSMANEQFAKMFIHPKNIVRLMHNLSPDYPSDDIQTNFEEDLRYVISNSYIFNNSSFKYLLKSGAMETDENGNITFGFLKNLYRIDRCTEREGRFIKKGYGNISVSIFIMALNKLKMKELLTSQQVNVLSMLMLNTIAYLDFNSTKDMLCFLHFYYLVVNMFTNENIPIEDIKAQQDYKIMISFTDQIIANFNQIIEKVVTSNQTKEKEV